MNLELVKAIVVLPGTVLVYVPAVILWGTAGTSHAASIAGIDGGALAGAPRIK